MRQQLPSPSSQQKKKRRQRIPKQQQQHILSLLLLYSNSYVSFTSIPKIKMDQASLKNGKQGLLGKTNDEAVQVNKQLQSYHGSGCGGDVEQGNSSSLPLEQEEVFFWRLADFGHVPSRSRDGSVHATDEVFNAISHLAACLLSILGSVLLISEASAQGSPWKIVSFSIYGASLVFLFGASTLHHAITSTKAWERTFRVWDYLAIFPLIAGTFTPLCLVFFHDSVIGWVFFGTVWTIALSSMCFMHAHFDKLPKWVSMTLYVTLGWLGAFLTFWLQPLIGLGGVTWMIAGGILYTIGGYIFTTEQPNPYPGRFGFHELWHIFVVFAAIAHWILMHQYVLPWIRVA